MVERAGDPHPRQAREGVRHYSVGRTQQLRAAWRRLWWSLPLLLDYTTQSAGRKRFQVERFWLKLDGFSEVVQSA
jgi:hypothetical protein